MDTTHSFKPSQLNQSLCAVCYRPENLHGKNVECESCSRTGGLVKHGNSWLCPVCLNKESEIPSESGIVEVIENAETITKELNKDQRPIQLEHSAINRLGSQSITRSEDFFNARTKAINERWKEIVADDSIKGENKAFTLAKEVREHYLHMKNVLFQAVEVQLECAANQRSDQIYLNQLASKLREEERVKLHLSNIDYVPPSIPKSTPKAPRVSKDDKIAADYAKIMGIPIETAKRLLGNKLKEVIGECTCKETPGICKLHSKG